MRLSYITIQVFLFTVVCQFASAQDSRENKLIGLEIGATLLPGVINEQNIGWYEWSSTWGVYGKFEFLKRHKVRGTFIWYGDEFGGTHKNFRDVYYGRKFTVGYEYELPVYRIFSLTVGAEYYYKFVSHEGVSIRYRSSNYHDFDLHLQGLNLPFGLMITLWKRLRFGLELGIQRVYSDRQNHIDGTSYGTWLSTRYFQEGHWVIGWRF